MLGINRFKTLGVFIVAGFVFSSSIFAEVTVLRSKGKVWFVNAEGERVKAKRNQKSDTAVKLVTSKRSRAVANVNGDILILSPNSSVEIKSATWLEQLSGFIYYSFRTAAEGDPDRKVTTQTATIGIRGTRLSVAADASEAATIALEEGKIEVAPLEGDFAIKRPKAAATFGDYKQQMKDHVNNSKSDFAKYKQQQQEAFVEYVGSVNMKPGQVLSINGASAEESMVSEKLEKQMRDMRRFAHDVLSQPEYKGL